MGTVAVLWIMFGFLSWCVFSWWMWGRRILSLFPFVFVFCMCSVSLSQVPPTAYMVFNGTSSGFSGQDLGLRMNSYSPYPLAYTSGDSITFFCDLTDFGDYYLGGLWVGKTRYISGSMPAAWENTLSDYQWAYLRVPKHLKFVEVVRGGSSWSVYYYGSGGSTGTIRFAAGEAEGDSYSTCLWGYTGDIHGIGSAGVPLQYWIQLEGVAGYAVDASGLPTTQPSEGPATQPVSVQSDHWMAEVGGWFGEGGTVEGVKASVDAPAANSVQEDLRAITPSLDFEVTNSPSEARAAFFSLIDSISPASSALLEPFGATSEVLSGGIGATIGGMFEAFDDLVTGPMAETLAFIRPIVALFFAWGVFRWMYVRFVWALGFRDPENAAPITPVDPLSNGV